MSQNEIESIVSGIKQLNALLVMTVPDCLLYSAWQRGGQGWDPEAAGAYLGQLVHSTEQGVQAVNGWTSGLAAITLEGEHGLIIVRQVKAPFAVGYVFDSGTAIGWARLQVQRTLADVEGQLESDAPPPAITKPAVLASATPTPEPSPVTKPATPAAVSVPATPRPSATPAAVKTAAPTPKPAAPKPTTPTATPAATAKPAAPRPAAAPRAPAPAPPRPAAPATTAPAPKPAVTAKPAAPKPAAPAPRPTTKPAVPTAPSPAASGGDQDATPKGTRLLKYLDTHAPDTHAALLRVSLQTGLPLTLLRMPDSLSDDEFAQVEESVRRILGVDQLNF
ncbi:MAG: hypothetical protein Tsb0020_06060 [Haliangiales bacterium]